MAAPQRCLREYRSAFRADLMHGRAALVTGGATGIGFRIAEALLVCRHSRWTARRLTRGTSSGTGAL